MFKLILKDLLKLDCLWDFQPIKKNCHAFWEMKDPMVVD